MTLQTIIVLTIILAAVVYAGNLFWKKAKSTTKNADCGSDCGCGTDEQ